MSNDRQLAMPAISSSILEATAGNFEFNGDSWRARRALRDIWEPEPGVLHLRLERVRKSELKSSDELAAEINFAENPAKEEDWSIAFTPTFSKSVAQIDRKLQGRVLLALSELTRAPTQMKGDTVKPLVGELKGFWRYRLGDYRLVYEPRLGKRQVVLLCFEPRGGAYDA
jgi:mRNA-degrading endonuclease RelE of RelBE toxin-antitoxin system